MNQASIKDSFRPLFGVPCWGLDYGRQTNLSLNFGNPSLHVREPCATESDSPTVQELASRRQVTVHGEWRLWLMSCYWQLLMHGETLATGSSSLRKIHAAMQQLSGQKLASLGVNGQTGFSQFCFDLGCELRCRRFEQTSEDELWVLYTQHGDTLSVYGNGSCLNETREV